MNMEVISCHSAGSRCILNFRVELKSRIGVPWTNLSVVRGHSLISKGNKSELQLFQYGYGDPSSLRRVGRSQFPVIVNALDGYERVEPATTSKSYNSYVFDGEEDARNMSSDGIVKSVIPGLPDENKGEYVAPISSAFRQWKPKLNIHYEKSGSDNVDSPHVLFLPGFGVGSFHYEKQLKDLGRDFQTWAMDFLGQGFSLPSEDPTFHAKYEEISESDVKSIFWGFGDEAEPWAKELSYSMDLWKDQVRYFIEEVIGEPVYVVGNSLGGFVALYLAACYPHLVKGVTLINATPFWGFLPNPVTAPRWSRIFPWAGTFPLPSAVKTLTEIVWEKISDPETIAEVLKQVYADHHSTNVDNVFSRILEITKHPAAAASFASIMCSPRGELTFKEALSRCKMNNVPVCLVYGKDDPWVKPIWGFQVKRQLPEAPYYQISPAGHCPHDEVAEVVNFLIRGWIKTVQSEGLIELPLIDETNSSKYDFGKEVEFTRQGSRKLVRVHFYGSTSSIWNRISSFFISQFRKKTGGKHYFTKYIVKIKIVFYLYKEYLNIKSVKYMLPCTKYQFDCTMSRLFETSFH